MIRLGLGLGMPLNDGAAPGGGGFPVWLPTAPSGDRPLIYADFKNGHYWADGGIVASTDLFYTNPAWGTFDPASIVTGFGLAMLTSAHARPSIVHTYLTFDLKNCTVVYRIHIGGDLTNYSVGSEIDVWQSPDYTYDAWGEYTGSSGSGSPLPPIYASPDATTVSGSAIALAVDMGNAFTVTGLKTTGSMNGGVITSVTGGAPGVDPTDISVVCIGSDPLNFLTSFAIYAPQPDADLPALSTP